MVVDGGGREYYTLNIADQVLMDGEHYTLLFHA